MVLSQRGAAFLRIRYQEDVMRKIRLGKNRDFVASLSGEVPPA
jgi:hypothetical protein